MPTEPAGQVARQLTVPILGIGAGPRVDGQLVIMHDVLGFYQAFRPWFAKCYIPKVAERFHAHISACADLRKLGREERRDGLLMLAQMAVMEYVSEVRAREFPSPEYCYEIQPEALEALQRSKYWKAL
jgi:ketopantoate hydroxymethyltransferase